MRACQQTRRGQAGQDPAGDSKLGQSRAIQGRERRDGVLRQSRSRSLRGGQPLNLAQQPPHEIIFREQFDE